MSERAQGTGMQRAGRMWWKPVSPDASVWLHAELGPRGGVVQARWYLRLVVEPWRVVRYRMSSEPMPPLEKSGGDLPVMQVKFLREDGQLTTYVPGDEESVAEWVRQVGGWFDRAFPVVEGLAGDPVALADALGLPYEERQVAGFPFEVIDGGVPLRAVLYALADRPEEAAESMRALGQLDAGARFGPVLRELFPQVAQLGPFPGTGEA